MEINIPWPGWEIVRKIGSGGYGIVYEIKHTDFMGVEEHAAMKVIRFPQDDAENTVLLSEGYDAVSVRNLNRERLDKVLNEYTLMMKMKGHQNIVRCDACEAALHEDGMGWDVYIRMELLTSLHSKLEKEKLSETEIIKLGKDLCQALMLCEEKKIVHRDIKPENIFVNEYGDYKLGDFGISRTMERTTNATRTGSYRFMAPEVHKDQKYGSTVDIYSLGLVLYWLLNKNRMPFEPTNRPPTLQERDDAIKKRVDGSEPLPPPSTGNENLKQVVLRACAFQSAERYSTALEFYDALEETVKMYNGESFYGDETVSLKHEVKEKKTYTLDLEQMGFGWKSIYIWAALCGISLLWMIVPVIYGEVSFSIVEIVLSLGTIGCLLYYLKKTNDLNVIKVIGVELLILNYQFGWTLVTIANYYGHYTLLVILSIVAWICGSLILLLSCEAIALSKKPPAVRSRQNNQTEWLVSIVVVVIIHALSIALLFVQSFDFSSFAPRWICLVLLAAADIILIGGKNKTNRFEASLLSFVVTIVMMVFLSRIVFTSDDLFSKSVAPVFNHLLMPNIAFAVAYCMQRCFTVDSLKNK